MSYYQTDYWRDVDTAPKTQPCRFCARDVQSDKRCFCVASRPFVVLDKLTQQFSPFIVRP